MRTAFVPANSSLLVTQRLRIPFKQQAIQLVEDGAGEEQEDDEPGEAAVLCAGDGHRSRHYPLCAIALGTVAA